MEKRAVILPAGLESKNKILALKSVLAIALCIPEIDWRQPIYQRAELTNTRSTKAIDEITNA